MVFLLFLDIFSLIHTYKLTHYSNIPDVLLLLLQPSVGQSVFKLYQLRCLRPSTNHLRTLQSAWTGRDKWKESENVDVRCQNSIIDFYYFDTVRFNILFLSYSPQPPSQPNETKRKKRKRHNLMNSLVNSQQVWKWKGENMERSGVK
jgi:hypothetical protein